MKNSISKKQWEQALEKIRKPLGVNTSRTLIAKHYHKSLPGVPRWQYLIIRFKSSFKNKKSAIETITPMLGKNGKWQVAGYYIK